MRRRRHTEDERKAIIERVHTSGRSLAEIAAEEGVSRQTLQGWMRASPRQRGSFIEVPTPRATVVELRFPDGTVLRVEG
jgi:transposase-like protein